MSRAAHTHLIESAEARAADETALRYVFGSRCPPACKADWRCQQGDHPFDMPVRSNPPSPSAWWFNDLCVALVLVGVIAAVVFGVL